MTDDLIARLDAAIGGPDRRTRDGRVRKLTPLKVETQLLLDAKAEIERLHNDIRLLQNRLAISIDTVDGIPTGYGEDEIDRLRRELAEYTAAVQKRDAEIERLRMELTKIGNNNYNPALVIAEQQAEIERLREDRQTQIAARKLMADGIVERDAEIERLRDDKKDSLWVINQGQIEINKLRNELEIWKSVFPDIAPEQVQPDRSALLAEIKRLRNYLWRIAWHPAADNVAACEMRVIAWEALDDE